MREIYIPQQGGGYNAVRLPSVYRSPLAAAAAARELSAKLLSVEQAMAATKVDPTDAATLYDLMNNSNDRHAARSERAKYWQEAASLGAQYEIARAEAVGAERQIGGVVIAATAEYIAAGQL